MPANVSTIDFSALNTNDNFNLYVEYGSKMSSPICTYSSCFGATSVTVIYVDECPTLTDIEYLYVADCDSLDVEAPTSRPSGEPCG